ncbi:MAG: type IV secretory system conjugative DNA transfer family protein, partial [Phycisphaerales bacterium]|nr:type IV secretory system conjugative DNA transfer family protein [Phycisphaerales bacterium]
LAAGLVVVGHRILRGRHRTPGARLALSRDLKGLTSSRPVPGRLALGGCGRKLVLAEPRHSVLVIGPPQTGKTTALAIPAILDWPGPVLTTSSKSDVLEVSRAARARRGPVMVYDPMGDPESSVGWTPLAGVTDWAGAQGAARGLMSAHGALEGVNEASFWQASAEMLIAPLLLAAAASGEGMAAVIEWLDAGFEADPEVQEALEAADDDLATSAWRGVMGMEARTRTSVTATARTVLAAWWDPGVLALGRPELTPERLLDGGSLFLVAPTHDQERLRSVFAGIVSQMTRAVYDHRARTGRRLDPGLLVVLDEAAHIAPVRNLPELAATGPEPGIQLVSVFHDTAQISAAYGRRAATIIANHRARLYLPGIGDPDTLQQLSRSLGDTEQDRTQTSVGPAGTTRSTSAVARPLIPAHELRELPDGEALLVYGARPPARIRLRPWFTDRRLRRLARGEG